MSRLGPVKRSFVSAMRVATRLSAGYDMGPILEEMVRIHRVRGTVRLMKFGNQISTSLAEVVGLYRAQTLISCAAIWNGCRYCVIGHMHTANLVLFNESKTLGPVDEDRLIELMYMTDEEAHEVLRELYSGPEEERTWYLIDRMYKLRFHRLDPEEDEDELLRATLSYWEWLNECTIILGVDAKPEGVPALGYIPAPSAELVNAYAAARKAHRLELAARAVKGS